ncbi:MAG: hypothetical protein ACRD4Q_01735 [Candidatus Acidiferrales bacterium]
MGLLDLIGAFGGAIGSHLLDIGKALSTVVNGVLALLRSLSTVLAAAINALGGTFLELASYVIDLYDRFLKSWVGKFLAEVKKIRDKVQRFLQPLIRQIQIMRQQEAIIFQIYIKPLLNFIQRLRQALLIFRLFHLKFAQQLDQDLATIEGKIAQAVLDTRAQLNRAMDMINLILDPLGNLRYGLYIQVALSSIGALTGAILGNQNVPLTDQQKAQQAVDAHVFDSKTVKGMVTLSAVNGMQEPYKSATSEIYAQLAAMGYPAFTA